MLFVPPPNKRLQLTGLSLLEIGGVWQGGSGALA
jgi:hypothetical protein